MIKNSTNQLKTALAKADVILAELAVPRRYPWDSAERELISPHMPGSPLNEPLSEQQIRNKQRAGRKRLPAT